MVWAVAVELLHVLQLTTDASPGVTFAVSFQLTTISTEQTPCGGNHQVFFVFYAHVPGQQALRSAQYVPTLKVARAGIGIAADSPGRCVWVRAGGGGGG